MNAVDDYIVEQIGKQFGPVFPKGSTPKGICWDFCKEIQNRREKDLPNIVAISSVLKKVKSPVVFDVVIFKFGEMFHGGIIWPDGLHFVHAVPREDKKEIRFVVERGRLTAFPWNTSIEGFYHVE